MAMQHLGLLHQTTRALQNDVLTPTLRQQAEMASHSLAGTLGMLGLTTAAQMAKDLEQLLQVAVYSPHLTATLKNTTSPTSTTEQIEALVYELQQAIQSLATEPLLPPPHKTYSPLILIIDPDPTFTQSLVEMAASHNIRAAVVTTIDTARTWLYPNRTAHPQTQPELVLLKLPTPTSPPQITPNIPQLEAAETWAILEELAHQKHPLPVLAITEKANWQHRLQAIRQGGQPHILESSNPQEILTVIGQILAKHPQHGAKIMVVEDDPFWLQTIPKMLDPWGFQLNLVANPLHFWDSLTIHTPDLLILDIKMPNISGLELCKVLRSDPQWNHIPILFLSALTDIQNQDQAFNLGADDFVCKPVNAETLASRILNRLTRVKSYMHKYCTVNTAT